MFYAKMLKELKLKKQQAFLSLLLSFLAFQLGGPVPLVYAYVPRKCCSQCFIIDANASHSQKESGWVLLEFGQK